MKILVIHTYYNLRGGEDAVFEQETSLLDSSVQLRTLAFSNSIGFRGALQFLFSIWNSSSVNILKKEIDGFNPDIIHIHNLHFASGPLLIRFAKKLGIPIIVTLHNYRLLCPSATLLYKDSIFLDSLTSGFPWSAIRKKLYRDSSLQTFWLGMINWFHKVIGTWFLVDKYILLTDFAKEVYANSWLGKGNSTFVVKPNFVPEPCLEKGVHTKVFLFVGRLSAEKGIKLLLEVFSKTDYRLQIAGTGPLVEEVVAAGRQFSNIVYLGNLDKESVLTEMNQCTALLFPSIWYEGMPMTILEAFSLGTPVIASNLGAMASMITHGNNGLHFEPGNVASLRSTLDQWSNADESYRKQLRENARKTYELLYTPERNLASLLAIYNSVIDVSKRQVPVN